MNLSNQPPKGTSDWMPEEYRVRKYIFDTWRKVCEIFGYKEYLTPIVESAEVYRAKSGEDIGGKELMSFLDKAGRELAIRPEMTPSVTRMVTKIYESQPKPLRLFSIANFFRNEKPQRGRNREFWQLNADIFGSDSLNADIEILQLALEIMVSFRAQKGSFTMFINNRKLIDFVLNDIAKVSLEQKAEIVRVLDKFEKLGVEEFERRLVVLGLQDNQVKSLLNFMQSKSEEELLKNFSEISENQGFIEIKTTLTKLGSLGYSEWVKFQPNIIRGFDYYDGMVFEVFDNNPENSRAMFGGGRYNGLAKLFGSQSFPATGFAPGDETTKLFLEGWNLIPESLSQNDTFYFPVIDEGLETESELLAQKLRQEGKEIIQSLDVQKIGKALDYANKTGISKVIIFGSDEKSRGVYKIKEMQSGEELEINLI